MSKPLPITELLRRVGDDNIGVQTPLAEGTFLAANKRKGYTALEFATYPELAEEMWAGRVTKTLLVLVMDEDKVQRAKSEHNVEAPLPLTERERELLAAARAVIAEVQALVPEHETIQLSPALFSLSAAIAKAEGRL